MTLILRSDSRAQNHLGGAHGYTGPLDYVAMLDFASDTYFLMAEGRRVSMSLDEAVAVARESPGVVRRRDMSLYTVPENTPRISYNSAYGMSGLLVEKALQNFVTSPSNGSTVNIPAAASSGSIVLSFEQGDVSLSAAEIAHAETYTAEGRICKRYTRSSGSAISATLSVSGGAQNIQAVISGPNSGISQGNFLGYGGTQAVETATLSPAIASLVSGGNFSVVMQTIANATGAVNSNNSHNIAVRSALPQGGCYHSSVRSKSANGTDSVQTVPDSSGVNNTTPRASVNGTWNDLAVMGVTCSGRGDQLGVISFGQYNKTAGLGPLFGSPSEIILGGLSGVSTTTQQNRLNGIITRVAIYDRMLTDDEAWDVANAWR